MTTPQDDLVIRSYRLCFELERRIFRIDRWRIPAPYGVPLAGIAYAVLALLAVLVLGRLPIARELLDVLHPALRFVVLPAAVAYAATRIKVDGRPAHAAALAWLRWRTGPARVVALREAGTSAVELLGNVAVVADEGDRRYRPCRVRGPACVTLRYPAIARSRRRRLDLQGQSGKPLWHGKQVRLGQGQLLRVR